MANLRFQHVTTDIDRHGNVRYYFRRRGQGKIRLPGLPGSAEFMAAYQAALAGIPAPTPTAPQIARAPGNSLQWLCNAYCQCPEFKGKSQSEGTRALRRRIFRQICAEPLSPGSAACLGDMPFAQLLTKNVRMLRDRKGDTPQAANNWVKALRALFKWAVSAEHCELNPAIGVPLLQVVSDGFHTWTQDELRQFEAAHSIGTQARLAMALCAFTGQRISDIVGLGPQHIEDGRIRFTQKKGKTRHPVEMRIPVLPILAQVINATPCGHLTYLVNERGAAWSSAGFGNKFKSWCVDAGLPHCSAHGLRKAAAVAAGEGGATTLQLMAIFGWRTQAMADVYTRKASQSKMADASMHLLKGRE